MRKIGGWILILLLVVTSVGGCAGMTRTEKGAATGAVGGGALGALIGGLAGGWQGAAIGAGVGVVTGAITGALVGDYLDNQIRDREAAAAQLDYKPTQGTVLKITRTEVVPTPTKPGEIVQSKVEYSILTTNPTETITIKEQRLLLKDGQNYAEPVEREIVKPQGGHVSTYKFTLPEAAPEGRYTVLTVLEQIDQAQVKQRQFTQSDLLVKEK